MMKIIYRKELPGEGSKETVYGGWVAALIGLLVVAGLITLFVLLLPIFLIGILSFFAFIFFLLIAGWIWLAVKIGWRDMWELTKLVFGIGSGGSGGWKSRRDRIRKEWEDRVKGKSGIWTK